MSELSDSVKSSWHRFLDEFEPLRPELYRYCRHLTRSPWDAEDLVQDALARAFVTLGCMHHDPPANPRAWLFRVASNLWVDRMRRRRDTPDELAADTPEADPQAVREAAGTLLGQLSPQERAAVVLRDMFELSLEEVAEVLSTTVGAVKAALHRGRGRLISPAAAPRKVAVPAALDAFCEAFNARDLPRLTALLLDTAVVQMVSVAIDYGPDQTADETYGALAGLVSSILRDTERGIDPRFLEGYLPTVPPRVEVAIYRDAPILLHWYTHTDGEAVRAVSRVELEGARIRHLSNYFFVSDVIAEVCRELDVPFRVNGYRYW
ncbi:RNA polymerase sigma factor [Pendulispora rubella]|uniref:RNA polymerase sigma factor n=1 Tax=Pendulispora rubella TaxID=2741070 RepID=UPI0030E0C34B